MSFWQELQKRRVFKVCAAYAVIAWLIVQVADVVLPAFEVPAWVFRGFLLLIASGFGVAAVLSWIYDLTPEGVERTDDRPGNGPGSRLSAERRLDFAVIALLGLAVAVLLLKDHPALSGATASNARIPSLAVLAFSNRSSNPDDAYFADGLADEILSALSGVRNLRVAPRTSSFYFKGRDLDAKTIAETLGVQTVLSGSVQRVDDRIHVSAALDGFAEGAVLWSESYHRDIDDLLEIQSEIALSVASAILPVLSPESRASLAVPPTRHPEAYDFYLRARDYMRRPPEKSTIESAARLFDRAIERDPEFAEAWAGRCNLLLGKYEFDRNQEAFQAAEAACDRAQALDPDSWEVDLSLGKLFRVSGRYDRAVERLEAGLEKHPNNVGLLLALARTYADQDRVESAEKEFRRAEALDGGSWLVQNEFGILLGQSGRKDEAIERFRKVIELTPDSGIGYDNLANTYLSKGSLVEAREAFAQSPSRSRWTYENLGLVNYFLGEFEAAAENHERALELAPDNFIEWGNLGDAYRFMPERGQDAREAYRRAIELCEQALAVNPDDLRALARLSTYYVFTGQPDRAEALLGKLTGQPDLPGTVHFFVARTKMHLGNLEAAYEHLREAIDRGWSRPLVLRDPDLVKHAGDERFARM